VKRWLGMARQVFADFGRDEGTGMAAALSYYTVFSLPPLLVLLVTALGAVIGPGEVERLVTGRLGAALGPGAAQLREILAHAERPGTGLAGALGVAGLLLGATGALVQLQGALNRIWEVRPDPRQGGVRSFITKRLLSFGMLLTLGFLLLVSLVISTLLEAFGDVISGLLPGSISGFLLRTLASLISLAVVAALFAVLFRYVPDARIAWKDARIGGLVTALLFTLGKFVLGLYLGRSDPGSAFGAAGALALLLVWIYYSAIILLLGAEFTQVWAREHGRAIEPEPGAVRVVRELRIAGADESPVAAGAGAGGSVLREVGTQEAADRAAGVRRRT
jgi:membrane protein